MIRVRRDVTRPYSAATKNAFSRISPSRASSSRTKVIAGAALRRARTGRQIVVQANQSAEYSHRLDDTNVCSILAACGSSTARSRARSALNRVKGMPFDWSLNPYMGCVHRCTFCYVRAFELRADRPADDRYGTSIRVKVNIAERAARASSRGGRGDGEPDRDRRRHRSVPAGRGPLPADARLPRGARATPRNPFSIITRGPLIVRDVDVLAEASRRADVSVTFSVPTLDDDVWRTTEPGTAPPRQRLRALRVLVDAGVRASVGMAPLLPGLSDRPEQLAARGRGRARGRRLRHLGEPPLPQAGHARALPRRASRRDWPELLPDYERALRTPRVPRRGGRGAGPRGRAEARARARDPRPPAEPLRPPPRAEQLSLLPRATRIARNGRRDHRADRRRPRGRPRRPAPLALARAAHPRRRRGSRRRVGGRARGAPQARRRDHGRPHARHGRARGDEAADRAGARLEGADLHRLLGALAAQPRARVGRQGLHPQGGAAPDARARDREGRRRARATSTRR